MDMPHAEVLVKTEEQPKEFILPPIKEEEVDEDSFTETKIDFEYSEDYIKLEPEPERLMAPSSKVLAEIQRSKVDPDSGCSLWYKQTDVNHSTDEANMNTPNAEVLVKTEEQPKEFMLPPIKIESESDESIGAYDAAADPLYSPSKCDLSEEETDNQTDTECPSSPLTSDQLSIANEVDALLIKACSETVDGLNTEEEIQPFHQEKEIHLEDGKAAPNFFVLGSVENLCSQEETADVSHKACSNKVDGHNTEEENQPVHYEEEIHSADGKAVPGFFVPGGVESDCSQEETIDVSHTLDQQENSLLSVGQCKISQKRVWDKKDCCIYCDKLVTNFTRHVARNHAEELEVGKILSQPKGSKKRRILFEELRKKGNFYYNKNCLRDNAGSLIVVQRPKEKHSASKYLPCRMCLGFFSQESLYRHMQKCKLKTVEDSSRNARSFGYTLLIVTPDGFDDLKMNIFPTMRADNITRAVQEDSLICEFGARMLQHHKDHHMKGVISQKMRELGRLKLELKTKIIDNKNSSSKRSTCQLEDYIDQDLYKQVVSCVHSLAGFDCDSGKFKIPSLGIKLGFSLKTCAEIVECKGIMTSNEKLVLRGKRFAKLLDKMWKFDVSLNAAKTLSRAKWNRPKMLPLSEDLECLHDFLINKGKSQKSKPAETEALNLENVPEDPLVTNLNSDVKISHKKRRATSVRRPWSIMEKEALVKHFKTHIMIKRVPNKEECLKCIEKETCLGKRSWSHVKFQVKNMFGKL